MKKLSLVVYSLALLLAGALLGGGIAYCYHDQTIKVGNTEYNVILFENRGQITIRSPKKAVNVRDQGPHVVVFNVVDE